MIRKLAILVFLLPLIAVGAAKIPRLYNVETKTAFPEDKKAKILPDRIYMVLSEEDGKWYYGLTDSYGEFTTPFEQFRSGSVVAGRVLGAKNQEQRYILTKEGVWEPSFLEEQHFFWVLSKPPRIKVVGFQLIPN